MWSSLFTILACTWAIQHPNIPEQDQDVPLSSKRGKLWRQTKGFLTKAKWMLITVLAPEAIIMAAASDLTLARKYHKKLKDLAEEDGVVWTWTHTYYANMGGFVLRGLNGSSQDSGERTTSYRDPYHLGAPNLEALRRKGAIRLPDVSESDITDRCKNDAFLKAIAVIQIVWSLAQAIVRVSLNLAICPLEISVAAFAICALIIYGAYWQKPMGPQRAITVEHDKVQDGLGEGFRSAIKEAQNPDDDRFPFCTDILRGKVRLATKLVSPSKTLQKTSQGLGRRPGSPFQPDHVARGLPAFAAVVLGAILFGPIHLAAWNFPFVTNADMMVWRLSSLYTVAYAPAAILVGLALTAFDLDSWATVVQGGSTFLYILARLVIVVKAFRSLAFLPPSTFTSTWTTHSPHV
jgi:hypothetical protein